MQRKWNTVVKDCGTVGNKVGSGKNELTAVKAKDLKLGKKWDKVVGQGKIYTDPSCGASRGTVEANEGFCRVQQDNDQKLF